MFSLWTGRDVGTGDKRTVSLPHLSAYIYYPMLITRFLPFPPLSTSDLKKNSEVSREDNHSVCMALEESNIPIGRKIACQQEGSGVERTVAIIIMR